MTDKARKIESKDIECSLCYLLKSQNKDVKFHLYDEGTYYHPADKYVCEHCLNWTRVVKHMAHNQAKNPDHDCFRGLTFWWAPKNVNESAIAIKDSKKLLCKK
jgi:hypothetical protein